MTNSIQGEVVSGTGYGAYYLGLEYHQKNFGDLLGTKPFPGTLNLKFKDEKVVAKFKTELKETKTIPAVSLTKDKGGNLCPVDVYPVIISFGNDLTASALIACSKITCHGENILEIVSDKCLRKEWDLKNGNIIKIEPGKF